MFRGVDPQPLAFVEVLATSRDAWYHGQPDRTPGQVLATVEGEAAAQLVQLWQQLPAGEVMRCFMPRYGMRIWDDEGDITDVVLCFSCHMAMSRRRGKTASFGFDADDPISRTLLAQLKLHDSGTGGGE